MRHAIRALPFIGMAAAAMWGFAVWRGEPTGAAPLILALACSVELGRRAVFHKTAKSRPLRMGSPEHETVRAFAGYLMVGCACVGPTLIYLGLYFLRGEHLAPIFLIGGGLFIFPFVMSRPIFYLIDRAFRWK